MKRFIVGAVLGTVGALLSSAPLRAGTADPAAASPIERLTFADARIDVYYGRFAKRTLKRADQTLWVSNGELPRTCSPVLFGALEQAHLGKAQARTGMGAFDYSCEFLFWGPRAKLDEEIQAAKDERDSARGKIGSAATTAVNATKLLAGAIFGFRTGNIGGAGTIASADIAVRTKEGNRVDAFNELTKWGVMMQPGEAGPILRVCHQSRTQCYFIQGVLHKPDEADGDKTAMQQALRQAVLLSLNIETPAAKTDGAASTIGAESVSSSTTGASQ